MGTGTRLREERERLAMNQAEFGAVGGVKKLAQLNYEKGERMPDAAYLAAIAAAGADVLYIVTGLRAGSVAPLSRREAALLDNYRASGEDAKKALETTSVALAQSCSMKKTG